MHGEWRVGGGCSKTDGTLLISSGSCHRLHQNGPCSHINKWVLKQFCCCHVVNYFSSTFVTVWRCFLFFFLSKTLYLCRNKWRVQLLHSLSANKNEKLISDQMLPTLLLDRLWLISDGGESEGSLFSVDVVRGFQTGSLLWVDNTNCGYLQVLKTKLQRGEIRLLLCLSRLCYSNSSLNIKPGARSRYLILQIEIIFCPKLKFLCIVWCWLTCLLLLLWCQRFC